MARGPTPEEIQQKWRKGLHRLQRDLTARGLGSTYIKAQGGVPAYLAVPGCGFTCAGYRLLRASNGEASLLPRVWNSYWAYEGFDAFDKLYPPLQQY